MSRLVIVSLAAVFIVACGAPAPAGDSGAPAADAAGCMPCAAGYARPASAPNCTCELDANARWVVTAVDATVPERDLTGASWDALGGLPDPKACATLGGVRTCTAAAPDTLRPAWGARLGSATAAELRAGVRLELLDEDLSSDDTICAGTVAAADADLYAGTWTITCDGGVSLRLALAAQ